ncbi:ferrochelatase [Usitatibacter palustris]|uniref:Ferrochelatase n=1 Tax=Usitatibacter palustris TaxID=2732487 RepID=A0A6M4H4X4_9PROT|nr:ferrochelatase [Usitatibacter palustris]QJR14699.1 Ferrochelatase [Usitatibacter palustris]
MGIERTGVLLVNLGTPDEPTPRAVRRYLREFLMDPRVVQIPPVLWWPILNFLVLPFRGGTSAEKYKQVWTPDGSPLRVYLERQAQMLKGYMGERLKVAIPVVAAMRYGKPSIAAGMAELKERNCKRLLVLPLYPQYSASTTASVEDALAKAQKYHPFGRVHVVQDFHDNAGYVKAVAKNINDYWMKHGRPDRLVLSFHGLPKAMIDAGDPYKTQCHTSARLIATELGWNDARTIVTFQSRFGKAEWIGPATDEVLSRLGWEKAGRVDVACPGFASDCLETLEEIAIEGRKTFRAAGGKEFHYIPTTNDTPAWMTALTAIALDSLPLLYDR